MPESIKASPISSSKPTGMIAANTPTLFLVRHGDTNLNSGHTSPEKFRSHLDVPLSAQGMEEAHDLAKKLKSSGAACVYSSDLSRAAVTGETIADALGIDCEEDDRLRPWDLGELAGTDVKKGIAELKKYAETPDKPLPGGESLNDFKEKYLTALDEIMDDAVDHYEKYIVVTHTRDLQLTKASAASPNGFADHEFDVNVFEDYSNEVHTGDILKLVYSKGAWLIQDQEKG